MSILRRAALLLAVAALAMLAAAEFAGRQVVERIAERQLLDAGAGEAAEVVVGVTWWKPSVLPALLGADLDRVQIQLRDVEMYPLTVSVAEYVLRDLDVEVSLRSRTLGVGSLSHSKVRLLVEAERIGADLGVEATVDGDRLLVGPDRAPAELTVDGDELVVTSEGLDSDGGSLRLSVLDPSMLPCEPNVRIAHGLIVLRCTGDELPGLLRAHLAPPAEIDPDVAPPPVQLEPPATLELDPSTTAPSTTVRPTTTAPATTAPSTTAPAAGPGD